MGVKLHNSLTVNLLGGGNSEESELASSHAALIRGDYYRIFMRW